MPLVTRSFVKLGLLWFVVACAAGLMNALWHGAHVVLMASWLHLLVVGWVSHLIFGVALWMFPRWTKERPQGPAWVGMVALALLNLGLVARVVGESFPALGASREALIVGAAAQWLAGVLLVFLLWPRVRGR